VTSRHLRARLFRELLKDVSLRVEETDTTDAFRVMGRGEMHLSILIETMRREGYEFQVSTPRVLYRTIDGRLCEPIERLVADVPQESVGVVMEKMGVRRGELMHMQPMGERMRLEFHIPSRGLFGYRGDFLTDTKGEGILNAIFYGYEPVKGDIPRRQTGSLIAFETGEAVTYGLFNAQERGTMFIDPGTPVYAGMIVGVSPKTEDIAVNVCKKKHVTNMRAAGSDEALRLVPPKRFSLEESLEFLSDDELLEVTPASTRLRKKILDHTMRMRSNFQKKSGQ
jgi:GTP-binding protein